MPVEKHAGVSPVKMSSERKRARTQHEGIGLRWTSESFETQVD